MLCYVMLCKTLTGNLFQVVETITLKARVPYAVRVQLEAEDVMKIVETLKNRRTGDSLNRL